MLVVAAVAAETGMVAAVVLVLVLVAVAVWSGCLFVVDALAARQ